MPLLSVLWGIALLSLVTVSLLSSSTTSQKLARNALNMAQMDAVAEAAVVRAVVGLIEPRPDRRWQADGRPESFALQGIRATVAIQDELGRIDLNYADRSVLFGLLRSAGADLDSANDIVEAILEWRATMGTQPGERQASRNDRAPAAAVSPRHGLFQGVDELRLVAGMTPQLYRLMAPALTVYSQHQMVDPQLAPREVLLALPGVTPEQADQTLGQRRDKPPGNSGTEDVLSTLKGRAFTIRVEIDAANGKRTYQAVVRLTDDPHQVYWLLDWRDNSVI
jgi:general secretion pathway protein K